MSAIDQDASGEALLQADSDARLSRLLLRAARDGTPVQDVIDCADLAGASGRTAIAAQLAGLALLQLGCGPHVQAGFSVDLAIAELRNLFPLGPRLADDELAFPPVDAGPHQRAAVSHARIAEVTDRTDAFLVEVPALIAAGGLARALHALADDILALPPAPPNEYVAADPATLASLLGLHHLRRFLIANHDLLRVVTDGRALFDAAAQFGPASLGPYFSNVRMLIRNARDIFAMIDAAGDRPSRDTVETWCILLSAHLRQHHLIDLIDELGDRGMTTALHRILARAARADGPHYALDPVWRIRDVCLDIGEWGMAADAQQVIALWRPRDPNEWRILAEIRAEMDDKIGVEGALERAMLMCPDDPATRKRMAAWQAGVLPPIAGGYGTLPGRRRVRQARLNAYRAMA